MFRQNECRLNFKNRPVRTGDIKGGGGPKQPPLPLIGVARSLPLIGLKITVTCSSTQEEYNERYTEKKKLPWVY